MKSKLLNNIDLGFDGDSFVFARFMSSHTSHKINTGKLKIDINVSLSVSFIYEVKDFASRLKRIALLLKRQDKIALNKKNLISIINPRSDFVRKSIKTIYDELQFNLNDLNGSTRVRTLYKEWDRVFGTMYGDDDEATSFTEVSPVIKETYGYSCMVTFDSKVYLFELQTFFNMFLKLLIYSQDNLLTLAASAEAKSEHPLGKAIASFAKEKELVFTESDNFKMSAGKGIFAEMKSFLDDNVTVGSDILPELEKLRTQGKASILVAKNDCCIGVIALSDVLKLSAKDMVSRLGSMNTDTVLLTGDNKKTAGLFCKTSRN